MLRRKIYDKLLQWKKEDSSHTALCIVGARQVGKTTIVREFAAHEYEHLIELNFLTDPRASQVFSQSLAAKDILLQISALTTTPMVPGRTLLLLDEIQECPAARTAVKFLVEDGQYDIIETGSMLGVNISSVKSYPVGFEKIIHMYPLDFEEFLWASHVSSELIQTIRHCYQQKSPVPDVIHQTFLELFLRYMVIGGMPAVVTAYLDTGNLQNVYRVQTDLLNLYRQDIQKYALKSESPVILEIFNAIPSQLNDQNRRFVLSQVIPKARLSRNENAFLWIALAGLALPSYALAEPRPPFILNEKRKLFRLFLFDTGLLCAMSGPSIQFGLLQGDTSVNKGSVLENVMATQLVSNGFPLYYYNSKQSGELDFLIQEENRASVLEVKSGSSYRKHPALNKAMANPGWQFENAFVLCRGNVDTKDGITYLPWYMIMFLAPKPVPAYQFAEIQIPEF